MSLFLFIAREMKNYNQSFETLRNVIELVFQSVRQNGLFCHEGLDQRLSWSDHLVHFGESLLFFASVNPASVISFTMTASSIRWRDLTASVPVPSLAW